MSIKSELESAGWHLSQEGIDLCCQGLANPTVKDVIKKVNKLLIIVKLLALALTNLVLDLANLVTNLANQSFRQPSHQPDQT